MPRGDRTGPLGMGPRTGRAAGYCSGFGVPGYANPAVGRGMGGFGVGFGRGRGMGFGRGFHRMFYGGYPGWAGPPAYPMQYPEPDPQLERTMLANEADALRSELAAVIKRLDEIEAGEKKEPPVE